MALLASDVLGPVRLILLDPNDAAWSDAELIDYLAQGIRATCAAKPDAYTETAFVTLSAGPLQLIPEDGIQFFELTRNELSGQTIQGVSRKLMDNIRPGWPNDIPAVDIIHTMKDENNPLRFWCWPPSDGTSSVEMVYGAQPTPVTEDDSPIEIEDTYQPLLYEYVLYLAFSKNSKRNDVAKAASHLTTYENMLGARDKAQHMSFGGKAK